ncbi:MAG: TadE/TadG family type IV pilus assembly protein [bacterium]
MISLLRKIIFKKEGQALVEFALIAPLFIMIFIMGTLQLGIFINFQIGIASAAREAARWGAVTSAGPSATFEESVNAIREKVSEEGVKYMVEILQWNDNYAKCDLYKLDEDSSYVSQGSGPNNDPDRVDGGDSITVQCSYEIPVVIPLPGFSDLIEGGAFEYSQYIQTTVEDV